VVVRREEGQALVLIAIVFLAMLMTVGLAVDAGQLFVARRTMQEAADAAAYAGAVVLYQGGTITDAFSAATLDATRNGFTHGVDGATVTVNAPPLSGPSAGNNRYVEVIIDNQVRTALVPAQSALTTVRVRGVAGAEKLNNSYAIMAINRGNVTNAFNMSSSSDVHLFGGGILVNSTSTTAATNTQNDPARFTVESPHGVNIAGGTTSTFPGGIPVTTGIPQQADPLSGFPKPSTSGLPVCNSLAGCRDMSGNQIPGIYTVPLGDSTDIRLNSGIYILKAGVSSTGGGSLTSNSGGVFLFNTTTNYPSAGGTCGGIGLAGTAESNLAAMTTGTYKYFLVYQDPACTAEMSIAGTGLWVGSGTVYLPSARFRFSGNGASLGGTQLVADTVDLQNGNLGISFDATLTAQPVLPRLSE
jgi:hypothetical protein